MILLMDDASQLHYTMRGVVVLDQILIDWAYRLLACSAKTRPWFRVERTHLTTVVGTCMTLIEFKDATSGPFVYSTGFSLGSLLECSSLIGSPIDLYQNILGLVRAGFVVAFYWRV